MLWSLLEVPAEELDDVDEGQEMMTLKSASLDGGVEVDAARIHFEEDERIHLGVDVDVAGDGVPIGTHHTRSSCWLMWWSTSQNVDHRKWS